MMKIQLWSETKTGKWAASLTLIFIIFIVLKFMNVAIIRLPFPTPLIAVIGVVGFIMGVISIIKNKDRSLLVLLSILIGLLIIFWVAAEIAFPH